MLRTLYPYFVGFTLVLCLLVILWGAWVRISDSGDACGTDWPSCQGEYRSPESNTKTFIEWSHRASSAVFGGCVLALVLLAFLLFPKKHPVQAFAVYSLLFTIIEALIGAGLVIFGLTGQNTSLLRAGALSFHLLNTLLLVGSLVLCWRRSSGHIFSLSKLKNAKIFIILFLLIASLGPLASLSNTLFPSTELWQSLKLDFQTGSHFLLRLRILHPLTAIIFGIGFLLYTLSDPDKEKLIFSSWIRNLHKNYLLFFSLALLTGLLNLILLSPVFLKLTHLLMFYMVTISFLIAMEETHQHTS